MSTAVNAAIFLVALSAPLALAWLIARATRLRQYLWKLAIVFYSVELGVLPLVSRLPQPLKLGIDLSGGTILVYELDPEALEEKRREMGAKQIMDNMVAAINKRINPGGQLDVAVRPVGAERLEIIVPGGDPHEVERLKGIITNIGSLEFRILANERDHEDIIEETRPGGDYPFPQPVRRGDQVVATWVPLSPEEVAKRRVWERARRVLSRESGVSEDELQYDTPLEALAARGSVTVMSLWTALQQEFVESPVQIPPQDPKELPAHVGGIVFWRVLTTVGEAIDYVSGVVTISLHGDVAWHPHPDHGLMFLVIHPREEEDRVTGDFLRRTFLEPDERGRPAVAFVFNSEGARRFRGLTQANRPAEDGFMRRLAIMLNDEIPTAPNLREEIGGRGQISGDFTQQEAEDLITVLNAGALPAALSKEPASQYNIGATLGTDTIRKGTRAIMISMIVVPLFMLIYYWFAGAVADAVLVLNLLIVLGVMSLIQANFTMSGLAGLALSVGMAVDANVLIYERIREEQSRGASFRMAIRNGFDRARRTVVDSNLTTLLTALILYWIGTDQVKGFAVTLILGILLNMYTALYVSRLVFEMVEQKRWVRRFQAFHWITNPGIDFFRMLKYCVVVSLALIGVGLCGFFVRGVEGASQAGVGPVRYVLAGYGIQNNLDIDFTGGTAVAIRFHEMNTSEEVRSTLRTRLPDITVEELHVGDEPRGRGSLRFLVRTSEQDFDVVESEIDEAFGERLVRLHMEVEPIEGSLPESESAGSDPAAATQQASDRVPEATKAGAAVETDAEPDPQSSKAVQTHRWSLRFDQPVPVSVIETLLDSQLAERGIDAPQRTLTPAGEAAGDAGSPLFSEIELATERIPRDIVEQSLAAMQRTLPQEPFFEQRINFGGRVAKDTQVQALWAVLLSMAGIVAYLWVRFQKVIFGLAAVVALIHDVLITLGLVALTYWLARGPGSLLLLAPFKIDLTMIAAFLTLIGYSLNDTIVVFDRIREVRGKSPDITRDMINLAVNQTLSRTLLTGVSTLLVTVILYVWGGEALRGFSFCLTLGVITGTYSSIYIASPALLWLSKSRWFAGAEPRRELVSR